MVKTIEDLNIDDFRLFVKNWQDNHKFSFNEIKKRYEKYKVKSKDNKDDILYVSTLSRFINEANKPRLETILQIGRVIFRSSETSLEQIIYATNNFIKEASSKDLAFRVKIGTGWTVWSSLVTSLIQRQQSLTEREEDLRISNLIQFTICDDADKEESLPFWIKSSSDLQKIVNSATALGKRYIADDLNEKLDNRIIDAAFLLRPTFDAMKFNKIKKPILVARIGVGHGSHLYCIRRKKNDEMSINVPMRNIDELVEARDGLYAIINNQKVITLPLGNKTVDDHRERLLEIPKIKDGFKENRKRISFESIESYKRDIKELSNDLKDDDAIILVIAFEPLNNMIFNSLQEELDFEIIFNNYNLSKLVDDRSSYGLYINPDLLDEPPKFKAVVEFIRSLDNYINSFSSKDKLRKEIASFVGHLYYFNSVNDGFTSNQLMMNALEDISYSIQFLPFLEAFVSLNE